MRYYNTETEIIELSRYCIYCGKKAKTDFEFDDRIKYDYYFCDCEGAKLDIEKQKIDESLNEMIDKTKKILNELKYKRDVRVLKRKYNIE